MSECGDELSKPSCEDFMLMKQCSVLLKFGAVNRWMSVFGIQQHSSCTKEWLRNYKYLIKR